MPSPAAEFLFDALIAANAIGFPLLCIVMWRRAKERRRRWDNDLCPECGYDPRALTGRCPECGKRIRKNN